MKHLRPQTAWLFLFLASSAFGQCFRFDPTPAMTTSGAVPVGAMAPLLAVPGASIAVTLAGSGTAAQTYQNSGCSVQCPANAQLTLPNGGGCFSTTGQGGAFGFWMLAGNYAYTVTLPNGTAFGPYQITAGSSPGYTLATMFSSLAVAAAATPAGGTLYVPAGSYTVTAPLAISGFSLQCQPGTTIQTNAAIAEVLTITGPGTIQDCGVSGNNSTTAATILVTGSHAGATVLRNLAVTGGASGYGLEITNSSNVKVQGGTYTGTAQDPIYAQDAINGLEIGGAVLDTTAAAAGAHCIGVHSTGTSSVTNGVFNVDIHDITVTAGQSNPCIEVGYFGAGRPVPAWPSKISVSHVKITQTKATGTGVSCSNAINFTLDDLQMDFNGFLGVSTEAASCSQVDIGHVTEINAAATQTQSAVINGTSNFNFHDFYLQGNLQLISTTPGSSGVQTTVAHGTVHDGQIQLQSGFGTGGYTSAVWLQNNLAVSGIVQDVHIHHLQVKGVSTSDGFSCFYNQDNAAVTFDSITIDHNSCQSIQYGFASQGGSAWTNYAQADNVMGTGVTWSNSFAPGGNYKLADFYQQPSTSSIGATTCLTGTGLDGTGGVNCNASLGSIVNYPGFTHGVFTVSASGTPAAGATILTLTIPAGVFGSTPTNCQFNTRTPGLSSAAWALIATNATTLQFSNNTGAGIPTGSYGINYQCTP